ncbi:hypothetical protein [Natronobiforma cellulositropha]|uniref:hypothetical protein n=1 Tax=Natronobiforma cellulositropha TaxID=1679076 RepID=UPI0021D5A81C|nr:hypothetical protein [Natronobiforma cellulositropha]
MNKQEWLLAIIAYTLIVDFFVSGGVEMLPAVFLLYIFLIALPIFMVLEMIGELLGYQ